MPRRVRAEVGPSESAFRSAPSETARGLCTFELHADRGLRWLNRNLDRFSPIDRFGGAPSITPFAELAVLVERAQSLCAGACAAELNLPRLVRKWRAFLIRHCNDRAYAELPRRMPSGAFPLLLPYLLLRATGYRNAFHEETIHRMTDGDYDAFTELTPYRVMDREYFLWRAGLRGEPDWPQTYAGTLLARVPNAVHIDKEAAYAITHTLFYLSDWGRCAPRLRAAEIDRVTNIVDCLIVHFWRVRHWDLLGELLLARACLPGWEPRLAAEASAAFLGAWRSEGYMLPEGNDIPALAGARDFEHETIIFQECYHTTLVGILYCLAKLERRATPS